ncbi:NAD dependent epimerase/dehydratase family protein [marine gamma proteobacterium HTCC2148]|jgi:NAD(P)-dependent dehydrogenase (short-subunit alcohol dehydrogenase family)|nr:NAD dependent epimerase/dehydratase family protein [marine gamma proteobacterium HTCC2148]MBT3410522.1 SDR family oxidoreductase [Halieaceae bacterium]MBT5005083.1 SDR family oxidoreductase [Halieaceae bacterium]MBT6126815.1 SDR family oxidoreductase [Halieaceae bacterium]MBT7718217.1 SDR family oxidoreductase [Halieaceae bacterium]
MFFDLSGKRAFITGGASGIGLAVARRFAEAGARVVIADMQDGQAVATELGGTFVHLDVSDSAAMLAALAQNCEQDGKLDILINNAGINGADGVTIEDSDEALTRKLLEINTLGVYHGLKHGPAHIRDGGAIINTASLGATLMFPGSGPYSATKAAVINLTQMSALELAPRKIRVNAVAPSFIRTPLAQDDIELFEKIGYNATAAQRIAEPEEVAAVFHFLASDDASYMNGQVINVDGGMSLGFTNVQLDMISQ